jgi:hypothetical protein
VRTGYPCDSDEPLAHDRDLQNEQAGERCHQQKRHDTRHSRLPAHKAAGETGQDHHRKLVQPIETDGRQRVRSARALSHQQMPAHDAAGDVPRQEKAYERRTEIDGEEPRQRDGNQVPLENDAHPGCRTDPHEQDSGHPGCERRRMRTCQTAPQLFDVGLAKNKGEQTDRD